MSSPTAMAGPLGRTTYCLVILLSWVLLKYAKCDILVYHQSTDQILEEFRDYPATFGGDIPETGLKVLADKADPADGCSEMRGPPSSYNASKFVVIIARYNCSFEDKVRNAQKAGYAAVIVHNVGSNDLQRMSANHPEDLYIPSVFVGENSGRYIIENYQYDRGMALVITDDMPFNISNNLIIPFAIVIGLCLLIMAAFVVVRCIRERRRMRRHRLPVSLLKKIGIVKFSKDMQYDTCAICLDDYIVNDRLRVLPCHHAYHAKCIDPWLTKNRRVCPICKRKVFVRGERQSTRRRVSVTSDSGSSSDVDETSPLLNSSSNSSVETRNATSRPPASALSQQADAPEPQQEQLQQHQPETAAANITQPVAITFDDDDALLDDSNVQRYNNGRTLLFNSYAPIDQEPSGAWQRFKRMFQRAPTSTTLGGGDQVQVVVDGPPVPSNRIAINNGTTVPSSNNILNANLSGSFHADNDETTDDELIGTVARDEVRRLKIRSAPNLPSTSGTSSATRDAPDAENNNGSGSSSGRGRIGVAALPNLNYGRKPPRNFYA